MINNLKK